jgi:ParB/Sulfiredoxin domain
MKVHPVADLFPMMNEEELADLAQDIKTHDLIHPIVISNDGEVLIDGRNRLRACEIAGVKPRFERMNGHADPVAFILSNNVARRQMTKGQIAITIGRVRLLDSNNSTQAEMGRAFGVAQSALAQAEIINRHAPELADQVLTRAITFDDAYTKARGRKAEAQANQEKIDLLRKEAPDLADLAGISLDEAVARLERRKAEDAQLKTIENEAPDLVAAARNAVITVADAMAAFTERENKKQAAQSGATMLLARVVGLLGVADNPKQSAAELMQNVNLKMWPQDQDDVTSAHLKACADWFAECAKILKSREK